MGIGRKSLSISEKDKLVTAYHEVGHALTGLLTKGSTPLHKVTILPRGGALGFVIFLFRLRLCLTQINRFQCQLEIIFLK